jgi:hypothetical protein
MNPVEIEEAVSSLALEPFDATEFPFQFLRAFGNKETAIQRLRAGNTNQSDVAGALLQRGNIHIATCIAGAVDETLRALRESPKTASQKAKFILATDGEVFQAEDINGGGTVACAFADFHDHFGFFLPLAGITTVEQIRESSFDIKATGRLNKLYIELLKDNPEWAAQREAMNHFMARLIFCFFAEDTDIFVGEGLFSKTIEQMSARDASDTHIVMGEIFRAMDIKIADRDSAGVKRYADAFPYVNGQLFSGSTECPRFSKVARSYLLHIASLNWQKINPDIFGSMIQAVADDEERGALGMHYTSVPNILKVLNPLFLNDLREALAEAGDNERKLLNLRKRMAKIRVFDPACGSGNFLVIAYKEMRAVEAEINQRRDEVERRSDIPLTNFRGIELRDFPAEIARLALIIAEYQCDVTYRGQQEALAEFLPLDSQNWITCGNALRLDWLNLCPPNGKSVRVQANDLFETPIDQSEIDFHNAIGQTYICGNPPYKGGTKQTKLQKADMESVFGRYNLNWGSLDYVSGWFQKLSEYLRKADARGAFVSTNSICQGEQVARLWPNLLRNDLAISFAHSSFKWRNLAAHNAGVSVVIIGISPIDGSQKMIFELGPDNNEILREVVNINPYLVPGNNIFVEALTHPINDLDNMDNGNKAVDGSNLKLDPIELVELNLTKEEREKYIFRYMGALEAIKGIIRYCIWVDDVNIDQAEKNPKLAHRFSEVALYREQSSKLLTRETSSTPYKFQQIRQKGNERVFVIPRVSSDGREFLPVSLENVGTIVSDQAFVIKNPNLWTFALLVSSLHLTWIATVCGQLGTGFRYSNTLGWNTFPVPTLTDQNKEDLARCAEDILLAREAHFPATIADLYDPDEMPEDLRAAHERNDEVLERIYIGRRFRNDTERLEKLFELYTKMTAKRKAA